MKLLPLLLFCCATYVNAQGWFPAEAVWHYGFANISTQGFILGHVRIEVEGDTIINGSSFKILRKTRESAWPGAQPTTQVIGENYVFESDGLVMAHVPALPGTDTLYNMNAVPGDHWRLLALPEPSCDTLSHMLVTDTGTRVISGVPLRWLAVEIHYYAGSEPEPIHVIPDTIVERIGTLGSYLLPMDLCTAMLDGNEGGGFRCYSDSQISYTSNEDIPCDMVVAIDDEIKHHAVSIRQDPNGLVFLDLPFQERIQLHIYDGLGRHIRSAAVNNGSSIDLSSYPTGVYLLRLMLPDNSIHTVRVVNR